MRHSFATLTAAVSLLASPLAAQSAGRPTFGVFAGAAIPTSTFGDRVKSGYDVGAFLGVRPATLPVGLRFEGVYNRFDLKAFSNVHSNIWQGTANLVIGRPAAPGMVSPYLIGGLGVYSSKDVASNANVSSESSTKFGANGGAGIDLPLSGISVFAEARYHYVFTKDNNIPGSTNIGFVPINVGVRF